MSQDKDANTDRDLLSRLNALKKSTVSLDHDDLPPPVGNQIFSVPAPSAGRALHEDLLSRFKSLSGTAPTDAQPIGTDEKADDDKTVEELLADLGPSEEWDIDKNEEQHVDDLLKSAQTALSKPVELENVPEAEAERAEGEADARVHKLPAVDMTAFAPEPESDEEREPRPSKAQLKDAVDTEADDILEKILDEIRHEAGTRHQDEADDSEHEASQSPQANVPGSSGQPTTPGPSQATDMDAAFPKAPDVEPLQPQPMDSDLAARFASLGLPSAPTTKPQTKPKQGAKSDAGIPDEEIDTWCIICLDDATLRCRGCDGDLYCLNCWMEGHRSDSAGYEERSHKAEQFVKGGGKKKAPKRRVMLGA